MNAYFTATQKNVPKWSLMMHECQSNSLFKEARFQIILHVISCRGSQMTLANAKQRSGDQQMTHKTSAIQKYSKFVTLSCIRIKFTLSGSSFSNNSIFQKL